MLTRSIHSPLCFTISACHNGVDLDLGTPLEFGKMGILIYSEKEVSLPIKIRLGREGEFGPLGTLEKLSDKGLYRFNFKQEFSFLSILVAWLNVLNSTQLKTQITELGIGLFSLVPAMERLRKEGPDFLEKVSELKELRKRLDSIKHDTKFYLNNKKVFSSTRKYLLTGFSENITKAREFIGEHHHSLSPIWIYGERGTGKSWLGRIIAEESQLENKILKEYTLNSKKNSLELLKKELTYMNNYDGNLIFVIHLHNDNEFVNRESFDFLTKFSRKKKVKMIITSQKKMGLDHFSFFQMKGLDERKEDIRPLIDSLVYICCQKIGLPLKDIDENFYQEFLCRDWKAHVSELEMSIRLILSSNTSSANLTEKMAKELFESQGDQKQILKAA